MTSIEWTDRTWNPTRGCSVVSPGCHNCYAMKQAHRFSGKGGAYEGLTKLTSSGPRWSGAMRLVPEMLDVPLRRKKPTTWFVNSMSDLFHEGLTDEEVAAVFGVMAACPQHTFQVLTKRAERMRAWFDWLDDMCSVSGDPPRAVTCGIVAANHGADVDYGGLSHAWPIPNVLLGVSVEDQRRADERVPLLLQTPAALRFLSVEPLLGPVVLEALRGEDCGECGETVLYNAFAASADCDCCVEGSEPVDWDTVDWVIVGGESGSRARPMSLKWARSLVSQCRDAGVPCFVKQMGAKALDRDCEHGRAGKACSYVHRKGADMSEWPSDLRVRELP